MKRNCIKYVGLMIDSNLNWKCQINCIAKKIKRSIGIISKLRHYVGQKILVNLYYALVYPFLIYGIPAWSNTYPSTIQPLFIIQKKVMRIITFSKFDASSSPLFRNLNIIKLHVLAKLHIAIFIYKFHNRLLPSVFDEFFTPVNKIRKYNTRHASKMTFSLPNLRTNYSIFNIRFQGTKIWNCLDESTKHLSLSQFKKKIMSDFIVDY